MPIRKFHQGQSQSFDYDPKAERDWSAKELRAQGYKVKRYRETVWLYPPSTYPPKRYCHISKRKYTVYCVKTIGRQKKSS